MPLTHPAVSASRAATDCGKFKSLGICVALQAGRQQMWEIGIFGDLRGFVVAILRRLHKKGGAFPYLWRISRFVSRPFSFGLSYLQLIPTTFHRVALGVVSGWTCVVVLCCFGAEKFSSLKKL